MQHDHFRIPASTQAPTLTRRDRRRALAAREAARRGLMPSAREIFPALQDRRRMDEVHASRAARTKGNLR